MMQQGDSSVMGVGSEDQPAHKKNNQSTKKNEKKHKGKIETAQQNVTKAKQRYNAWWGGILGSAAVIIGVQLWLWIENKISDVWDFMKAILIQSDTAFLTIPLLMVALSEDHKGLPDDKYEKWKSFASAFLLAQTLVFACLKHAEATGTVSTINEGAVILVNVVAFVVSFWIGSVPFRSSIKDAENIAEAIATEVERGESN